MEIIFFRILKRKIKRIYYTRERYNKLGTLQSVFQGNPYENPYSEIRISGENRAENPVNMHVASTLSCIFGRAATAISSMKLEGTKPCLPPTYISKSRKEFLSVGNFEKKQRRR